MKKLALGALFLWAGSVWGQAYQPGSKVEDFTVSDLDGNAVAYSSLRGDVTVVVFIATKCPVSNGYNERMNALYQDYSGRGVRFVFLNFELHRAGRGGGRAPAGARLRLPRL